MRSINFFTGEYRFLSNFYVARRSYPVIGECATNEHFYQASKCRDASDSERIRLVQKPSVAKQMGRRVALRPDWESYKLDVMRTALEVKFAPGTDMAVLLLDTGDLFLREGNTWDDRFWGAVYEDNTWVGDNWLGWLLMAQRAALRA